MFQVIGFGDEDFICGLNASGTFLPSNSYFTHKYYEHFELDMGSIFGVHLDLWTGNLCFYLNRKLRFSKNVLNDNQIFKDGRVLFPMISTSVDTCCVAKLIFSGTKRHSLLNLSLDVLPKKYFEFLPPGLKRQLKWERELPTSTYTSPCINARKFSWFLYFFYRRINPNLQTIKHRFDWFMDNTIWNRRFSHPRYTDPAYAVRRFIDAENISFYLRNTYIGEVFSDMKKIEDAVDEDGVVDFVSKQSARNTYLPVFEYLKELNELNEFVKSLNKISY